MNNYDDIMRYLRRNPLKNVTLLKMMTAYHQVMDSYLVEQAEHWGILLLLPADVFAYDRRVYPEADYVVLMDYSNPEVLPDLISRIPAHANLVFKLQQEARIAVAPHFPLTQVRSFYSFSTAPGQIFKPDKEAIVNEQLDERLLPLWMENGYTPEELAQYFEDGAFSVAIFKELTPLSTCIVFRNGEQIWEIGAVHTAETGRRQGLAARIVKTALHHTMARGYIPRYQVQDTNIASIRLAEAAGLTLAVKLEHWINYTPQQK
ncbi:MULTISPECIES: GNAT family N-acetyltransferase [unclassified Paenibacillus]|uniref:GNAT family N-acetyltransferase n=1 Tax=unclassified Paenibacillus TaxID=185978 RepID=UPI0024057FE9|nr:MULTISPECIES: GNAT family N-acetyltransferase [unclassified Paenibacillus]MDF9841217.1 GNAT superfamily N-acetyltransferase [Paenibacillus sp. PastF-2]MDF9847611.1 GNAT superfamily N-acetyltransferase [Paenibacillus sp. PastM-2]MDF9854180.1 GNAT superfamily N-acetyltransferase [Paenibacillus sp. PastF-1]MDH6479649.1 GNAT superfamily N-acetyltransferase [Paenibacillus sp. PastH-2]MDH6505314.1 GNAT superfamily N-acetyltransferase [Paenibacillus sp. PastM-3]